MLTLLSEGRLLGSLQALVSLVLALGATAFVTRFGLFFARVTTVALFRGLVQLLAVGAVLLFVLEGAAYLTILVLISMTVVAAVIASGRAKGIPGAFRVTLYGLGRAVGLTLGLATLLGVIGTEPTTLIPIGGLVIAQAMMAGGQALERFQAELTAHVGRIEVALSLGTRGEVALAPYLRAAVEGSLIPRIDTLKSLGIVWIPGLMAGMILSGANPVDAALYQFVLFATAYTASVLTAVLVTLRIRRHVLSAADQLVELNRGRR